MGRGRSRDQETDSIPRRLLRRAVVGEDELDLLSVHERHLWPAAASDRVVGPEAIRDRHLSREVRQQIQAGRHLTVDVSAQTWDGNLALGSKVRQAGWAGFSPLSGDADRFTAPAVGYFALDAVLETDEVDAVTVAVEVDGTVHWTETLDLHGTLFVNLRVGPVVDNGDITITCDKAVSVTSGRVVCELVDRSAPETTPTVQGTVTDGTDPVEGATVTVDGETATTDDQGRYSVEVTEGAHTLTVTQDGYVDHSESVTLGREWVTVDVEMSEVTVSGTVTDSGTGSPVEGASVTLNGHSDTTDANGDYLLSGVEDGSYTLTVTADGYDDHTEPVTISRTSQTIDVALVATVEAPTSVVSVYGSDTDTSSTQVDLSVPSGTNVGDILVYSFTGFKWGSTITFPSGWNTIMDWGSRGRVAWRRADADDAAGETYTWTGSGSNPWFSVALSRWRADHFPSGTPFGTAAERTIDSLGTSESLTSPSSGEWCLFVTGAVHSSNTGGTTTVSPSIGGGGTHLWDSGSVSNRVGGHAFGESDPGVSVSVSQLDDYQHAFLVSVPVGDG